MPTYCYSRGNEVIERVFSMEDVPETVRVRGRTFHRDFQAECAKTRPPGNWPMESDALGVAASQVAEAEAESRAMGIPTHFTKDGCAILTSPEHRRRYAEALGYFDRNGGYSDPQRR